MNSSKEQVSTIADCVPKGNPYGDPIRQAYYVTFADGNSGFISVPGGIMPPMKGEIRAYTLSKNAKGSTVITFVDELGPQERTKTPEEKKTEQTAAAVKMVKDVADLKPSGSPPDRDRKIVRESALKAALDFHAIAQKSPDAAPLTATVVKLTAENFEGWIMRNVEQ